MDRYTYFYRNAIIEPQHTLITIIYYASYFLISCSTIHPTNLTDPAFPKWMRCALVTTEFVSCTSKSWSDYKAVLYTKAILRRGLMRERIRRQLGNCLYDEAFF